MTENKIYVKYQEQKINSILHKKIEEYIYYYFINLNLIIFSCKRKCTTICPMFFTSWEIDNYQNSIYSLQIFMNVNDE